MKPLHRSIGAIVLLAAITVTLAEPATRPAYTGAPYNGQPIAVPGVIKATEYDIAPDAANGIAFDYHGKPQAGNIRKTKDGIGLGQFGKDHVTIKGEPEDTRQTYLGWTHAGEWTKYSLHVAEAGTYSIGAHVAAGGKGGQLSFAFSNGATTGPIDIPTTAGYQPGVEVYHVWERLDHLSDVKLDTGDVVMTLKIEKSGGFNIESITLTKK